MLLYIERVEGSKRDKRTVLPMVDVRPLLASLDDVAEDAMPGNRSPVTWVVTSSGPLIQGQLVVIGSTAFPNGLLQVPSSETDSVYSADSAAVQQLLACLSDCWKRSRASRIAKEVSVDPTVSYNVISWLKTQKPADVREDCVPLRDIVDRELTCWTNGEQRAVVRMDSRRYGWVRPVTKQNNVPPPMNVSDGLLYGPEDTWWAQPLQSLMQHFKLVQKCPAFDWRAADMQLQDNASAWLDSSSDSAPVIVVYYEKENRMSTETMVMDTELYERISQRNESVVWKTSHE